MGDAGTLHEDEAQEDEPPACVAHLRAQLAEVDAPEGGQEGEEGHDHQRELDDRAGGHPAHALEGRSVDPRRRGGDRPQLLEIDGAPLQRGAQGRSQRGRLEEGKAAGQIIGTEVGQCQSDRVVDAHQEGRGHEGLRIVGAQFVVARTERGPPEVEQADLHLHLRTGPGSRNVADCEVFEIDLAVRDGGVVQSTQR